VAMALAKDATVVTARPLTSADRTAEETRSQARVTAAGVKGRG
jgi:hypothetical protein